MTDFSPQNDARCAQRITINRSATIHAEQFKQPVPAKLLNISMCGAGILCNHNLSIGEKIILTFSLPSYESDHELSIASTVACFSKVQKQYLIGVAFEPLNMHEELVIKSFTSYHKRF